MSGALRSFDTVKQNLEAALLLPNGPADLFAHIYYEPSRSDHRRGLQWLRNAPYARAVVAEVFDEALEADVVAAFPGYDTLRAEDQYGVNVRGTETSGWLSMLRKIVLANELRAAHEAKRGAPYVAVVRTRPDLAYGVTVPLRALDFRPHSSLFGSWPFSSRPRQTEVLYTPVPPANGSLWAMCERYNEQRWQKERRGAAIHECGRDQWCEPSPLAGQLGALAKCPCCEREAHAAAGRSLCHCNVLFPRKNKTSVRGRPRSVKTHTLARLEGHAPWGRSMLLDQLAIGTPGAMDTFASVLSALPARFRAAQGKGKRLLTKHGFTTETLIGTHVARSRTVAVRPVTWLQWGKVQDGDAEARVMRGGRQPWRPPSRPSRSREL